MRQVTRDAGAELSVRSGDGGRLIFDAYDLTLDTRIELQDGKVVTVQDAVKMLEGQRDAKLRCQTPFRESESMAGVFRVSPNDECPFIYDVGTNTTHWLCRDEGIIAEFDDLVAEARKRIDEEIAAADLVGDMGDTVTKVKQQLAYDSVAPLRQDSCPFA